MSYTHINVDLHERDGKVTTAAKAYGFDHESCTNHRPRATVSFRFDNGGVTVYTESPSVLLEIAAAFTQAAESLAFQVRRVERAAADARV